MMASVSTKPGDYTSSYNHLALYNELLGVSLGVALLHGRSLSISCGNSFFQLWKNTFILSFFRKPLLDGTDKMLRREELLSI